MNLRARVRALERQRERHHGQTGEDPEIEAWVRRLRRCERTTMEMHAAYERLAKVTGLPATLRALFAVPIPERGQSFRNALATAPDEAVAFVKAYSARREAFEDEDRHREQERGAREQERQREAAALANARTG